MKGSSGRAESPKFGSARDDEQWWSVLGQGLALTLSDLERLGGSSAAVPRPAVRFEERGAGTPHSPSAV